MTIDCLIRTHHHLHVYIYLGELMTNFHLFQYSVLGKLPKEIARS